MPLSKKFIDLAHATHTKGGEIQGKIVQGKFRDSLNFEGQGRIMKKQLSILAIFAAILLAALAASPVGANNGKGEVIAITGIVPGQDMIVHILALVPPGADRNEVAQQALANQGARAMTKQEFSTISLTWDQFDDLDPNNDVPVIQNYNPANDPTGGGALAELLSTQADWTAVTSSSFAFSVNGDNAISRCPSLVKECPGRQTFDGFNDVAWMSLKGSNTLGVTWSGTSIDEADMALNTKFNWDIDNENFDIRTVYLHENGHAAGLGHSDIDGAVMEAIYGGLRQDLQTDDIAGLTFKYPVLGPVVLTVTTSSLADGVIDQLYSETLQATNGTTPYSWAVTSGSLPAGLSLNLNTGEISGTPNTIETEPQDFTVQVTDDDSATDSATLSISITDVPLVASEVGVVGFSYATAGGKNGDKNLRITVSVEDDLGAGVENASVSIELTNDNTGGPWYGTFATGSDGTVTFQLRNAPNGGYTTLVTGITAANLDWDEYDGSDDDPGFLKESGNNSRGNGSLEVP